MEEPEFMLTEDGAAELREQLRELKGPRRDEMARRLRFAIQQGDLSENADYIAAKEDQAFLEGKIHELETILRYAKIIEKQGDNDVVSIGHTVVVAEDGGHPETYQIVGVKEADPKQGKISHESPLGSALIGKRRGETAAATTPGGELHFEILEIK